MWKGESCPVGYTRVAELDGKFIVADANYNPAAGGSNTHTHGPGSYSGPSHTHTGTTDNNTQMHTAHGGAENQYPGVEHPHTHPFTTSSSGTGAITGISALADSRPEFATVIFCQKD